MRAQNKTTNRPKHSFAADCLCLTPVCVAALLATGFGQSAQALPQGGQVVAGSAVINAAGVGRLEIKQASDSASIDWRTFSVGAAESLRITQPSSSSVLVNRVTGNDASQILGRIDANGRVFLSNPRGIVFGRDAVVDVGGLVATSLAIAPDNKTGLYSLTGGTEQPGEIIVDGTIRASRGTVVFAGPQISLNGQIEARRVAAAAVNAVQIDIDGDGLVFFKPRNDEQLDAKLKVLGKIQADGGTVDLRAAARAGLADTVLNMDGVVQARSIGTRNGQVFINGGAVGDTVVTGKIDVSGAGADERAGEVRVLGQRVGLFGSALIDASGASGGGLVHVGGGFQGHGEPLNASMTVIGPKANINASATDKGDGGQVVVWADGHTRFNGAIRVRGGVNEGNGGQVETSGKQTLHATGTVDAGASRGKGGNWLLDPNNISIDAVGAHTNVDDTTPPFFASTDDSAIVSNSVLAAALTGGTTIRVQAGSAGANTEGGDITVNSTVTSAGSATLTLDAQRDIIFTGSGKLLAGGGQTLAVNLNAGSNLAFTSPGTNTSAITMANGAQIVTGGANLSATANTTGITLAGIDTGAGSLTVNSNGGAITQNSALTVGGVASFNGGAASITLGNASNNFTGAVSLTNTGANNVQVTDANALTLGTLSIAA
ncbi:filamentous hemagglutinin N-terminal domain-containing protein, partial [Paucibacter sp. B2R-40]|uniref:two-partner secretion domain-containing protein n=1 Tax=Paucibacter sp. B2R-40 TaxID=2893554 RepID=UPI0021E4B9B0